MTRDENLIAGATLDDAWPIVEAFSKIRREHPDDGNRAISLVVDRLRAHGVPVTVHEPMLYLTVPKLGYVEADGRKLHARPAPMTLAAPQGVEAPLMFVEKPIGPPQGYGPQSAVVFGEGLRSSARRRRREGQDRAVPRHDHVRAHQGLSRARRGRRDRDQSRQGRALGRRQSDLGHRRSRRPAVQARDPGGRGEQAGRRGADRAGAKRAAAQRSRPTSTKAGSELLPVVEDQGAATSSCCCTATTTHGTSASATTPPATPACSKSRACSGHRDRLERSVRIAWWPGHSTGRFAGSTWYADTFARDLAKNCVAHMNCDSPAAATRPITCSFRGWRRTPAS